VSEEQQPEREWQRLDPRVMAIRPFGALKEILVPSLVALIGIGTQQPRWLLFAAPAIVVGALVMGWLPWLTTRFRVADGQLVLTTGLVNRKQLTAPLDRIRSVDLEASLLHRVFGLQKMRVGTGVDDTMIELNALGEEQASRLRGVLLSGPVEPPRAGDDVGAEDALADHPEVDHHGTEAHVAPVRPAHPSRTLAVFSPGWTRFAPFSLGRLAIAVGALGAGTQFLGDVRIDVSDGNQLWSRVVETSLVLIVVAAAVGGLVLWTVLSMLAYLVQWWDMRLTSEGGNLHLTRGLFTTASTTVEENRIRGVQLRETALLRAVDGGELHALVTGLEESVYAVLPQTPVAVSKHVATEVLGTGEPLRIRLEPHGRFAGRRCLVRNLAAVSPVLLAVIALVVAYSWPAWVPAPVAVVLIALGTALGRLEYAHLGHALTGDHLVVGSGTTARTRTVLETSGVIGWVLTQTLFQRRGDLATLVATTSAGTEKVTVRDVPVTAAIALARSTTPDVIDEFVA
jgi:putative membrane protein